MVWYYQQLFGRVCRFGYLVLVCADDQVTKPIQFVERHLVSVIPVARKSKVMEDSVRESHSSQSVLL